MFIKADEFNVIQRAHSIILCKYIAEHPWDELDSNTEELLLQCDIAILRTMRRYKCDKKKSSKYISERRKTDKNYARTPYVKVKDRKHTQEE